MRLQICSTCDKPPDGQGWLRGIKHDAHRLLAIIGGSVSLKLVSRNGINGREMFGGPLRSSTARSGSNARQLTYTSLASSHSDELGASFPHCCHPTRRERANISNLGTLGYIVSIIWWNLAGLALCASRGAIWSDAYCSPGAGAGTSPRVPTNNSSCCSRNQYPEPILSFPQTQRDLYSKPQAAMTSSACGS